MSVDPVPAKECRSDPGMLLGSQIEALSDYQASVTLKRERPWASITFTGTRHSFVIDWTDIANPRMVQKLARALTDHEFAIPGYFVADILITEQSEIQLVVEALSIVDPASNRRT